MALNHSPSIVTNGLVYYHDMGNTQKSWKGAPTTNVVSGVFDTTFESLANGDTAGFSNQLGPGSYLGVSSFRSYFGTKSLIVNRGVLGASTGRVYRTFSVALGEYSSVSAWVYSNLAGAYITVEYNGGDYAWAVNQTRNTHTGTGWELLWMRTTGTATSATTGYFFLYPGNDNTDTYWDNIQVEKTQYRTPYINGTRSNTQSIVDLTGNNTVTVNSLTYESDGTFSFNGSSNNLTIPGTAIPSGSQLTFSVWNYGVLAQASSVIEAKDSGSVRTLNVHLPWSNSTVYFDCGGDRISKLVTNAEYQGWHHWCFTKNAATGYQAIYLDGQLWFSGAASTGVINVTTIARIGSYTDNTTFHNGKIASVSLYNRALSDVEVLQNFNALKGRYGL